MRITEKNTGVMMLMNTGKSALGIVLVFAVNMSTLQAGDNLPSSLEPLDISAPPAAKHRLAEHWFYGLRAEFEITQEQDYDVDAATADKLLLVSPLKPSIALAWVGDHAWSTYANFEIVKNLIMVDDSNTQTDRVKLLLDKAHVTYNNKGFQLRAGRLRFKTTREWMFDDTIDGVRMLFSDGGYTLNAAVFRERAFTENLLDSDQSVRVDHAWLSVDFPGGKGLETSAYLLRQIDRRRDETVDWLGFDIEGEWEDLDYWAQFATSKTNKRGVQGSGQGLNVGGVYRLLKRPRVFAIAAYALGTGNANDVDLGFRQTDMQDNSSKLGGVTRLVYYGEVFDPELGNLGIRSIGLGLRPVRDASIVMLWHQYRQQYALDELRESDLSVEPNGLSRALGSEVDLVFGYRMRGRLRAELVLGKFFPGTAFDSRSAARLINFSIRYNF